MIFDGRAFAAKRREELLKKRAEFGDISLAVVMGEHDPVTSSFVRIKEKNAEALNVRLVRYFIPDGADTAAVEALVQSAAQETGMIVQLPLPQGIDTERVLASIPSEKDVDALSPEMANRLKEGYVSVIPPVAAAVREILESENITVYEKKVVVIGKGRLVGAPCAELLKHMGAHTVVLDKDDDVVSSTQDADVIVLGAGSPQLLKPEVVKEGVVVLDAGTSESNGVVVGDADPALAEKASFFTPVPGGIGPVAVVEIFGNLFKLA